MIREHGGAQRGRAGRRPVQPDRREPATRTRPRQAESRHSTADDDGPDALRPAALRAELSRRLRVGPPTDHPRPERREQAA